MDWMCVLLIAIKMNTFYKTFYTKIKSTIYNSKKIISSDRNKSGLPPSYGIKFWLEGKEKAKFCFKKVDALIWLHDMDNK